MRPQSLRAAVLAAALLISAAGGLYAVRAQDSGAGGRAAAAQRDPLLPPRDLYAAQGLPRLRVTVIGFNREHPERSLAVVRMETTPPQRRVVYRGDHVGEYRIVRIEATRVVALAPTFGGSARLLLGVHDSTVTR